MLLNTGPLNAAPFNTPGNNAGSRAGALASLLIDPEGLGNALEIVFDGASQFVSVDADGFAKPTIGQTTSIDVVSTGEGISFVLKGLSLVNVAPSASGQVIDAEQAGVAIDSNAFGRPVRGERAVIDVVPFGDGIAFTVAGLSSVKVRTSAKGLTKDAALAGIDVDALAQTAYVLGSQTGVQADASAFGQVIAANQAVIDVLTESGFVVPGANTAPVRIDALIQGQVIDGSQTGVDVSTEAFGKPTQSVAASIDVDSLGEALVSHLGLTEAGVQALAEADGKPVGGVTSLIEAIFAGVGQVQDGQGAQVGIESFMNFLVSQAIDATPQIVVTRQADGFVSGGAQDLVEAIALAKGQVQDGQASLVEVDAIEGKFRIIGVEEAVATLKALAEGQGIVLGGDLALVELETRSIGFILSKLQAPLFRIIQVQPKDKTIIVSPKRKSIVFSGDDRSLQMVAEFEKQPTEIVDYDIDMRDWFQAAGPEDFIRNIESLTIDPPGELAHGGPGVPFTVLIGDDKPQQAKVWLSGGVDGREYKVTALISTNIGRQEEIDFLVRVEDV